MRSRRRRLVKAGRRRLGRAWRRLRSRHSTLGLFFLLALTGGGLFVLIVPALHQPKPLPTRASRPVTAKAAAAPVHIKPPHVAPAAAERAATPSRPLEQAALHPPPPASPPAVSLPGRAEPAWLRFAAPSPAAGNRPLLAVVLDDLGLDRVRTAAAIRLPGLTLSFMTYADDLPQQTGAARRAGHELLLHVPMEALDRHQDPGPRALYTSLSRGENLGRLRWGLGRFDGFVGINNHMGSKFTADPAAMAAVIEELNARGLAFLDSRTTAKSVGFRLAAQDGVPHAARDVFLDDDLAPAAIARQLALVEALGRRHGSAIAIGHAHDATLAALRAWLPGLTGKGLVLVPVSAVIRYRMAEEGAGQIAKAAEMTVRPRQR